jgi:hypothetical protein
MKETILPGTRRDRPGRAVRARCAALSGLLLLALPLGAASLSVATVDAGGGRCVSTNYAMDISLSAVAGISTATSPASFLLHGFPGQLYEVTNLVVTASPIDVPETSNAVLGGVASLDDATALCLAGGDLTWSAVAFPLGGIDATGVVTTLAVYTDVTTAVTGSFLSIRGSGVLRVMNTIPDNYGSYAGDGLPDTWQRAYFGPDNTNAAPALNPDGDAYDNLQEYIADTNPTNAGSFFQLTAPASVPSARQIRFLSSSGRVYSLDVTTNLTAGAWLPVPGQTNVPGNGSILTLQDASVREAASHRVRVAVP